VNEDFQDMLAALLASGARFLVVGAHALAVHGVPRATGDLDVWVLADPVNAERVWAALKRFGAPVDTLRALTREPRPTNVLGTMHQSVARTVRQAGKWAWRWWRPCAQEGPGPA
jgi:hypothetical protein